MAIGILQLGSSGVMSDDVDARSADVLATKTYLGADTDDDIGTGTMPNNGTKTASLNCGQYYDIPLGYHNGSGRITANSLASQTGVDSGKTAFAAGHLLTGYQGWVNGTKISGTMANHGNCTKSITPATSAQSYTVAAGYHSTVGVSIAAIPNQSAGGAKYATTSAQTLVTAPKYITSNITLEAISQTNLAAANIKKGVTVTVSNGSSNIYSVTGAYVPTASVLQYVHEEPNNNYDYGKGQNTRSGLITATASGTVYYKWAISSEGTSGYEIYVKGSLYSTSRTGELTTTISAGQGIEYKYIGAHASSDHYGNITFIVMSIT